VTLDGRAPIVTGGNSGIGQAVVLALAGEGTNVVIDYVSRPEAAENLEPLVPRCVDGLHRGSAALRAGVR